MKPKLCLRVCALYQESVARAIRELGYTWVQVEGYTLPCSQPQRQRQPVHGVFRPPPPDGTEVLIIGACSLPPSAAEHAPMLPHQWVRLDHCLAMVTGREIWESETRTGAYLLTPSWLKRWREQLQRWGFDRASARQFFHECARELLLLDTGTDLDALAELEQFAAYVDRPYRVRRISLDYLKLFLAKIVLEWRLSIVEAQTQQMLQPANRKIAEYAMAFDLLVQMSQIQSEEATITAIQNLFAMLFGCTELDYAQIKAGQISQVFSLQGKPEARTALEQALATMPGDYALMERENGFYLRIHSHHEPLGLVAVYNIALPEHRTEYLNLGLAITSLCGLALVNARTYAALQEVEQSLRRERDLTAYLRQTMLDLATELDFDRMARQVLVHLDALIPSQESVLLLLEGETLRVVSVQSSLGQASSVGQFIRADQQPYALVIQRRTPLILGAEALNETSTLNLANSSELRSWMGVPLLKGQQMIGVLTIGSLEAGAYSLEHASITQVVAHEVTLALDNVRLLQAVQTLADTDPLTGLYNRRRFNVLAEAEFRRLQHYGSQHYGGDLAAIFIDIDHFKRVNDTFSHAVGDQVLTHVATCLKQVRTSDIVARYGGEEFVMISPAISPIQVRQIAERLRQTVASTVFTTTSGPIQVTISLGVAIAEPTLTTVEELIWRADQALYSAKCMGRNRVSVWGENNFA
ncbi:MAG: diguanylate cyclase [Chloroflexales bacterium]